MSSLISSRSPSPWASISAWRARVSEGEGEHRGSWEIGRSHDLLYSTHEGGMAGQPLGESETATRHKRWVGEGK